MHHLTSDTTLANLPFNEQKVSAYYSIMVVYLYVGEHHPLVNGRKTFLVCISMIESPFLQFL